MSIEVVQVMSEQPGHCVACGSTPTDVDGELLPAMDLNVDVNWGDSAYLCWECVGVIAGLAGYVTPEEHEKVVEELGDLKAKHEELQAEHEAYRERARQILEGKRARKELKEKVSEKEKVH